jgi:TRAP transporter TAXI family solute receptor
MLARLKHLFATLILIGGASFGLTAAAQTNEEAKPRENGQFITVGTAGVTGVYYPAGGAICRFVNRTFKEHGYRCAVESTAGSIYNINAIREGKMHIGAAQSDWQYHAYNGSSLFQQYGPFPDLRSLFSLHSEPLTVVVRKDSGIRIFDDLKGKRVSIGEQGSGMYATMRQLMDMKGWKDSDFKKLLELKAIEQGAALCENRIDAMVFSVGHPNGAIQEVSSLCETRIIPVDGPDIQKFLKERPYYSLTVIPGGMYQGTPKDVRTIGVRATFVTSAAISEDEIYTVVSELFDNFDNFKLLHPVFATLNQQTMVREGLLAPLHPGAEKYYREKGLLK